MGRQADGRTRTALAAIGQAAIAALTLGGAAMAQTPEPPAAPDGWAPAVLDHAWQHDMVSQNTGRTYRIFISLPAAPPPEGGYPVLYLLDGNAHFPAADRFAHGIGRYAHGMVLDIDQPIVVGIGYPGATLLDYPARAEDYTPPVEAYRMTGDRRAVVHGGADRFLDFLEQELKPAITAQFPVNTDRETLAGHAYGGLFALHALFTRPDSFETYVASSPSIWWNQRTILGEAETWLTDPVADGQTPPRLLMTVGELEQPVSPPEGDTGERAEILTERRMVENATELAEAIETRAGDRVDFSFIFFPGEDHYSAALNIIPYEFQEAGRR